MLRALLWTLRQRRYAALMMIMAVLAVACVGAGTFELHRYHEKRHDNAALRANSHAAAVALTPALVPLVRPSGTGASLDGTAVRYRTVRVTGVYDGAAEQFVDDQNQGGRQGFLVLTPLRTSLGTLLVARGFVAATSAETRPADVAAPPTGTVTIAGRLYPGSSKSDQLGRLGHDEITSVNPRQQAARTGVPVFTAYAALRTAQPGTAGLRVLPSPDLSNPSGGAGQLQLLSYVIQWYVFALLALIAPFVFARSEVRDARLRFLGVDPDAGEYDLEVDARRRRALAAAVPDDAVALPAGGDGGGALVPRARGELARPGRVMSARWQQAERLADRYGRSLGVPSDDDDLEPEGPSYVRRPVPPESPASTVPTSFGPESPVRSSASAAHRPTDDHHGAYNDYLWQLALADGDIPMINVPEDETQAGAGGDSPRPRRLIDGDPGEDV